MLGAKPLSFYDPKLKHGSGYENLYTLKKEISQNPKLYDASYLHSSKVHVNVYDTEEILDNATKSQIKMENKLKDPIAFEKKQNFCSIDYKKLNSLYETFVSQVELSAKQKYFSSVSITSETPSNASTSSSPPILNDQLLEATPKHDVEKCVLMCSDSMNNDLTAEIEKVKRESIDVQENLYNESRFLNMMFNGVKNKVFKYNLCLKERENVKLEYQKLFYSIKKTGIQSQKENNDLIENVNQKTYAYGDVRAQNQDLWITIFELKAKLKTVEKAGCGTRIRFWKDIWVGKAPLFIRTNLGARNLSSFRDMLNEIGQVNIEVSEDTCVWSLGPKSTFTVKDARNLIDQNSLPSLPSTTWEKSIPRKKLVYRWCDIPFVQALSFEAFKDWLSSWNAPKDKKHKLYVISASVLWWLWRFRNSVTFNSQPLRKSDIFDYVRSSSFSWLRNKDTTLVVAKTRFAVVTPLSAKNKESATFRSTSLFAQERSLSKYMRTKINTSRKWQRWYETQSNVGWFPNKLTANAKPSAVKSNDHVVIQIAIWIIDSGCSKHITGDLKLLKISLINSWAQSALETITLQQSQVMAIMYMSISLFFMYIMLKELDTTSSV
ncbi:hypothetical protein Tco_0145609 [Tanacetum coccineum]